MPSFHKGNPGGGWDPPGRCWHIHHKSSPPEPPESPTAAARAGRILIVEAAPEKLAQLRRLMGDDVSLNAAWHELNDPRNRPTPKATVDAAVFAVRERGLAALKKPTNLERLSRCDAAAKAEINERIEKLGLES
jgi:hypothetical protein